MAAGRRWQRKCRCEWGRRRQWAIVQFRILPTRQPSCSSTLGLETWSRTKEDQPIPQYFSLLSSKFATRGRRRDCTNRKRRFPLSLPKLNSSNRLIYCLFDKQISWFFDLPREFQEARFSPNSFLSASLISLISSDIFITRIPKKSSSTHQK